MTGMYLPVMMSLDALKHSREGRPTWETLVAVEPKALIDSSAAGSSSSHGSPVTGSMTHWKKTHKAIARTPTLKSTAGVQASQKNCKSKYILVGEKYLCNGLEVNLSITHMYTWYNEGCWDDRDILISTHHDVVAGQS